MVRGCGRSKQMSWAPEVMARVALETEPLPGETKRQDLQACMPFIGTIAAPISPPLTFPMHLTVCACSQMLARNREDAIAVAWVVHLLVERL